MTPVSTLREVVFRMLNGAPVPVLRWLPGAVNELPCLVVGRPNVGEGNTPGVMAVTVPVFALGRTVRDDEAQQQLDALGDVLVGRYWPGATAEGMSLRMTDLDASVVEVAGVDVPAYTASVTADVVYCP